MKKGIIVITIVFLLILIACEEVQLPESPTPPGRQGKLIGRTVEGLHAFPSWAAKPRNMFAYPEDVTYAEDLRVKILDYDFIYRFGYYFNTRHNMWEMFELEDGQKIKDWFVGKTAKADITITNDVFDIGENYIVLYACNKLDDGFECNDERWMLTFFRVIPEEPYTNWIIEDDISDFMFLSSKKDQRSYSGEKVMLYTAEYVKDNDKAIVEVVEVKTMSAVKSILSPWSIFIQNYKAYGTNYISAYELDNKYYVMWLSENVTVKISYEGNETPKDLVDAYLEMWPGVEIDFESGTIQPTPTTQQEVCGNFIIAENERCDPSGSDCLTEGFPVFEVSKGNYHYVDGHEIIVNDLTDNEAVIILDGIYNLIPKGQIKQFSNKGYIHLLRIIGSKARMAFGYQIGKCTDSCRCTISGAPAAGGYCGNSQVERELGEECEPPNEICQAGSGLTSICSNECKCPEPITGMTYCGDGIVQKPNSMRLMEQCEKPGFQCTVGAVTGWCSANCQCVPIGAVPTGCGDNFVDKPGESCDPPGVACIKNSAIGKCNANCGCDVFISQPKDLIELKTALCGVSTPPCYGIDEVCVSGGICGVDCTCFSLETEEEQEDGGEDQIQIGYCGTESEECNPEVTPICQEDLEQGDAIIRKTGPCTEECICEFTEAEVILPENCYDCPEDDEWHTCVKAWLATHESAEECISEGMRCGLPDVYCENFCNAEFGSTELTSAVIVSNELVTETSDGVSIFAVILILLAIGGIVAVNFIKKD